MKPWHEIPQERVFPARRFMPTSNLLVAEQSIMTRYSSGDFNKDLTMSTFALKQALLETPPRCPVDACAETSSPASIFSRSTEAPETPDFESEDDPQPLLVSDVVSFVDDDCEDIVLPEPALDSPAQGIKRRLVILGSRSRSETPNSGKIASPCADMFDPLGAEDTDPIDIEETPQPPRKLQRQTKFGNSSSHPSNRKSPAAKPQHSAATTFINSIVKPATMRKISAGAGSWKSLADSITMPPPCTKPLRKKSSPPVSKQRRRVCIV